jgi:phosphatidylserine/phosphatidylglycerophosphate/cardiolipin synthase-like enzyme
MTLLPAARNARIGLDDVTPAGFNRLLKAGREDRLQVLRIHKVMAKKHRYLPVQLLIYGDENRRELELAVCVEDDLATEHGLALDRIHAVERLGLKFDPAEPRPVLDEDLEDQRVPLEELGRELHPHDAAQPVGTGLTALVRSVSVFEHADLLAEALDTAKQRLLIISPWVRSAVVTTDFVAKLEKRLRAKVEVTIAHGIGDDDSGSDEVAVRRLINLAARYDNFTFERLANTHAKILIFDDHWVSTSFNWLSFRGDADRTYRMEEGTLVTIPNKVQEQYERYRALINDQRRA